MGEQYWERIIEPDKRSSGESDRTERIEVPGGWLYRTWISHKTGLSVALAFVPLPAPEVVEPLPLTEPPATVMSAVEAELQRATAAMGIPAQVLGGPTPCPLCGRRMCDHTCAERRQTYAEMMGDPPGTHAHRDGPDCLCDDCTAPKEGRNDGPTA